MLVTSLNALFLRHILDKLLRIEGHAGELVTAFGFVWTLEYSNYRNFENVIEKAREACKNSSQDPLAYFGDFNETVQTGIGHPKQVHCVKLSRYACYLIVQNADPSKEIVALGQTYFAIQTRIAEVQQMEAYQALTSEEAQG